MTTIGQYEILEVIGDGGMGTVYKARDPRFDRFVAVKVLHPHLVREPGLVDRFRTEAVIQAKLNHPHIVAVYDFIADERTLAIVMEYVDGRPLDRIIRERGGPLPVDWCIAVMAQVLSAVDLAHQQGLVHRDLKPSNILVREARGEPLAKVTDFGIARVLGSDKQRTATGAKMGTLAYMSPEHVRSPKHVDARSDLYALGAALYEMLTGAVPFEGESDFDLASKIVGGSAPLPRAFTPGLPPALERVVTTAMAVDPGNRYPDAEAMRQALRAAIRQPESRPEPSVRESFASTPFRGASPEAPGTPPFMKPVAAGTSRPDDGVGAMDEPEASHPALQRPSSERRVKTVRSGIPRATPSSHPALQRPSSERRVETVRSGIPRATRSSTEPPGRASGLERWPAVAAALLGAVVVIGLIVVLVRSAPREGVAETQGASPPRDTGMAFVQISPGTFEMGCSPGDGECFAEERPAHRVTLTRAFELGRTEVTQAQWEVVMGSNPSRIRGADRPVEQVSWTDAQQFLERLNGRRDGYRYRLPTEAEWEYAARAGTTESRYGPVNDIAWYDGNSGGGTHPVGQKQPNAWGLYDMLGNVWEWCEDWYGSYSAGATRDPGGPGSGTSRVLRGGSWYNYTVFARASLRSLSFPGYRNYVVGVRLVREVVP